MTTNANSAADKPKFSAVYRPTDAFRAEPFDSSAIVYTKFTDSLTRVLEALSEGAVIAIDGPWGSGKTYFGQNLLAFLNKHGWRASYVDAFALDYLEDPFLLLMGAIRTEAQTSKNKKNLLAIATDVGKALLPIAGKALFQIGTANAINIEKVEQALTQASGAAAEKVIEAKIKAFEKERQSFENFRRRLEEFAKSTLAETGKPLVIFDR